MSIPTNQDPDPDRLSEAIERSPVLGVVRRTISDEVVYVVGGTVRDLLIGMPATDLDLVVEGPVSELARRLDPEAVIHDRFETAELDIEGHRVDLARARKESYPRPGALPEVSPTTLAEDLARRDFTINSMAIGLFDTDRLIDPFGGLEDLRLRVLRAISPGSFTEDPTRVIRAARYVTRFDLRLAEETASEISGTDISTVSRNRLITEVRRLVVEPDAVQALEVLADWGICKSAESGAPDLGPDGLELLLRPPWQGFMDPEEFVRQWLLGLIDQDPAELVAFAGPPSAALDLVPGFDAGTIVMARAGGAAWLDEWLTVWRVARPVIRGEDLVEEGIPRGPAVGVGLRAALIAQLDRGVTGYAEQLAMALDAARADTGDDP